MMIQFASDDSTLWLSWEMLWAVSSGSLSGLTRHKLSPLFFCITYKHILLINLKTHFESQALPAGCDCSDKGESPTSQKTRLQSFSQSFYKESCLVLCFYPALFCTWRSCHAWSITEADFSMRPSTDAVALAIKTWRFIWMTPLPVNSSWWWVEALYTGAAILHSACHQTRFGELREPAVTNHNPPTVTCRLQ